MTLIRQIKGQHIGKTPIYLCKRTLKGYYVTHLVTKTFNTFEILKQLFHCDIKAAVGNIFYIKYIKVIYFSLTKELSTYLFSQRYLCQGNYHVYII